MTGTKRVHWTAANGTLWVTLQEERRDGSWVVREIFHFVTLLDVRRAADARGWPDALASKLMFALGQSNRSHKSCNTPRDPSEFDGGRKMCNRCKVRKNQDRRARTPTEKAAHAAYLRKRRYGLSEDDFQALLTAQGNVCRLCNGPFPSERQRHVDHDHLTGRVRGILCVVCNTLLGRVEAIGLDAIAEYLARKNDG